MIEKGFCQCGCGGKTKIAKYNDPRYDMIQGEPVRFVNHHHSRIPIEIRFWKYVDVRSDNECWPWIGNRNDKGYGTIGDKGKVVKAHRVAWALKHGPIPDNLDILHKCDNRPCCNPSHLFPGTQQDNIADMIKKNRQAH